MPKKEEYSKLTYDVLIRIDNLESEDLAHLLNELTELSYYNEAEGDCINISTNARE